jgi:hypothetical protein
MTDTGMRSENGQENGKTMRRNITIFFAYAGLAAWLHAGGFATLKMGPDARSAAMGLTGVAVVNGSISQFWNPALSSEIQGKDFSFTLHQWMHDVHSEFIGFGAGNGRQGYGVYVLYTEMGDMKHYLVPADQPLGTFSAQELGLGISYGSMITRNFRAGLSIRGYYEKMYFADTWGLGGDIGLIWEIPWYHVKMAGAVQNIGKTGRFQSERIPLPITLRLGLAWTFSAPGGECLMTTEGVREKGFSEHLHSGIEYTWQSRLSLRMGYQTGYETRDISGGMGILWNRVRLDYAYMPMNAIGDSHRLTLSLGW